MALAERLELLVSMDPSAGIAGFNNLATSADKSIGQVESRIARLSTTAMKIGAAGMGVGGLLTQMASGDIEAANQLEASVSAAGQSVSDFTGRIDEAIASQVKFGHTDEEVSNALSKLVQSYGDTGAALDQMQLTADLAAFKHISLADAAGLVAKAHGGAGRLFKEFNIQVQENADGTKDYDRALSELSGKLSGQASAAADSWGGKLRELSARAENFVSQLGQDFGPAILGVSTGLTALSGLATLAAGSKGRLAAASATTAAAFTTEAGAAGVLSGALGAATLASGALMTAMAPIAAPLMLLGVVGLSEGYDRLSGSVGGVSEEAQKANAILSALPAGDFFPSGLSDKLEEVVNQEPKYAEALNALGQTTDEFLMKFAAGENPLAGFTKEMAGSEEQFYATQNAVGELELTVNRYAEEALNAAIATGQVDRASVNYGITTAAISGPGGPMTNFIAVLQDLADKGLIAQDVVDGVKASAEADIDTKHQQALATWYAAIEENANKAAEAALRLAPAEIRVRRGALNLGETRQEVADAERELANLRKMGTPELIEEAERKLYNKRLDLEEATLAQAEAEKELAVERFAAAGVVLSQDQQTDTYIATLGDLNRTYEGPTHDAIATHIYDLQIAINKTRELREEQMIMSGNAPSLHIPGGGSDVGPRPSTGAGGPRATGGPVTAGQSYIVGEQRPEVFTPTTSGRIWPSVGDYMRANSQGQGSAPQVNNITVVHPDAFGAADETARMLNRRRILKVA